MPVSTVTNQVACELQHFLSRDEVGHHRIRLNPDDETKIVLTLQTDMTGNVGYVGIDLNKLGFTTLADLVAVKSNIPSLGVKGQIKSTVSAAVEVKIKQTASRLTSKTCQELLGRTVRTLFLEEWLTDFFTRMRQDDVDKRFAGVRMSTVTLKTEFQILVDISTGINPLFAAAVILPINGINAQLTPALTHKLDLQFTLCDKDKCEKKVEGSRVSPSTKRSGI